MNIYEICVIKGPEAIRQKGSLVVWTFIHR